jgi:toxin YoeB
VRLIFSKDAWEDYLYWQANDKIILEKVNVLIKDIMRQPYSGLGKPEKLSRNLSGWWSRRITQEHRIVYKLAEGDILISQLRYHYGK